MFSRPQNAARQARNINVFPRKNETDAEEAMAARVNSMFDDDQEEDDFSPQPPPRSSSRRAGLGFNDMSDIFSNN